jgi:M6 family metalloprotease-like protein
VPGTLRLILLSTLALALVSPAYAVTGQAFHTQTTLTIPASTTESAPVVGSQPTLVILVQFTDKSNSTSPSETASLLSGLNNYYDEDSYGLVSFATTISPASSSWYSLPQTMEYYSANTPSADDQLITDSLQSAYNAGVNFHNYKYAMIVHAGDDEAMTHVSTEIHSFTIPGFEFTPTPLNSFQISTSVVSESDPLGVYCHEAGHLLGLPDLYDLTQQIDPVNNFVGYWDIMALGEWNPNNGNPLQPSPGTFPSQHSAWSKIKLGWISNCSIQWVYPGNITTVTIHDLEQPTAGIKAVKIPIAVNPDGSLSYYLVEMRAKIGQYDQYLPFPSDYPGAALMIYKVNDSIASGHGNLALVDAHPGGDLSDAGFGPCISPCVSNNTFSDPSSFVKIIVTSTNSTAYAIVVDRTSSPLLLLQVDTPSPGMTITVDGANSTSDGSNELRLPVHEGPHEIQVETQVPVSLGATSVQLGLSDTFAAWSDGNTANPRWVSVVKDTVLTATYRVVVEPGFATAVTASLILGVIVTGIEVNRRRDAKSSSIGATHTAKISEPRANVAENAVLLPGNNGLGSNSVNGDQESKGSQS